MRPWTISREAFAFEAGQGAKQAKYASNAPLALKFALRTTFECFADVQYQEVHYIEGSFTQVHQSSSESIHPVTLQDCKVRGACVHRSCYIDLGLHCCWDCCPDITSCRCASRFAESHQKRGKW